MSQSQNANISLAATQPSRSTEGNIDTLLYQHLLQVQEGRLHPTAIPVSTMERVVELGCGADDWMFDLAKRYPRLHIYGIDMDCELLRQAKLRRNLSGLPQVEMRQMDLSQPLLIPDRYIDFVHMRRCGRFLPSRQWPSIIEECIRILRPNGWLVISEPDFCEVSSPA